MRVLIPYYSFTGQAARASELVARLVEQAGHSATRVRIDMAEPEARLHRPLTWAEISAWGRMASEGGTSPICLDPPAAALDAFDAVLLFSNTWSFSPAVPVQSFLRSPDGQRLLQGRPVAVYVVCRGFWKANLDKTRKLIEAAGGEFIGGEGFTHSGSWLASTIQTVRHMMSTSEQRRWGVVPLPAFGLSEASLARLGPFTLRMLAAAAAPRAVPLNAAA